MKLSTRTVVVSALLGGLAVVLGSTPLGFVPVPTPAGHATTMHIPAILAGILEGPVVGALVGLIFGVYSLVHAITVPTPASALFRDPLVSVLPRIFIGVAAYYAFAGSRHRVSRALLALAVGAIAGHTWFQGAGLYLKGLAQTAVWTVAVVLGTGLALAAYRWLRGAGGAPAFAALVGTLTNTVGVLGMIGVRGYLPVPVLVGVGILHGLPEILVAMVVTVPVALALRHLARYPVPEGQAWQGIRISGELRTRL